MENNFTNKGKAIAVKANTSSVMKMPNAMTKEPRSAYDHLVDVISDG